MIRVKVCGITSLEDALLAAELGADAVGFMMIPGSHRAIDPVKVREIIRCLPPFLTPVGVFFNEKKGRILGLLERTGLRVVQLHGSEPPEDCEGLGVPVIKTFPVSSRFEVGRLAEYTVDGFLLGSFSESTHDETGRIIDWQIAEQAKRFGRIIVSGGITPHNVSQALDQIRPYAVDVNSGVESMPGKKDKAKLADLIQKVKAFKG